MFRVQVLRWLLIPTVVVGAALFADVPSANAQGFSLQIGSPFGYGIGHGSVVRSHSFPSYGYGYGYGSVQRYGTGYRGYSVPAYGYSHGYRSHRPSYHYDYYPPTVVPHNGHLDYIPGHYHSHYGHH